MILLDVKTHIEKRYIASLYLNSYLKSAIPNFFTALFVIALGTDTKFLNFESKLALIKDIYN